MKPESSTASAASIDKYWRDLKRDTKKGIHEMMAWVVFAIRPLFPTELVVACNYFQQNNVWGIFRARAMINEFGPLFKPLMANDHFTDVQLSHQTAVDYFRQYLLECEIVLPP